MSITLGSIDWKSKLSLETALKILKEEYEDAMRYNDNKEIKKVKNLLSLCEGQLKLLNDYDKAKKFWDEMNEPIVHKPILNSAGRDVTEEVRESLKKIMPPMTANEIANMFLPPDLQKKDKK